MLERIAGCVALRTVHVQTQLNRLNNIDPCGQNFSNMLYTSAQIPTITGCMSAPTFSVQSQVSDWATGLAQRDNVVLTDRILKA